MSSLKILRPLLTPRNPLLQPPPIPNPKPNLKLLRLNRQTRLRIITPQRIQDRIIFTILRRDDSERGDEPDECCEEFAVCEVGASAHAGAGAVGIVGSSRGTVFGGEVAVWVEGVGGVEVGGVVIGGIGVLFYYLC